MASEGSTTIATTQHKNGHIKWTKQIMNQVQGLLYQLSKITIAFFYMTIAFLIVFMSGPSCHFGEFMS